MSTLPQGVDSVPAPSSSSPSSSSSWWGFVSSIAHQSEYLLDSVAKEVNHLQHSLTDEAAKLFQETTDNKQTPETHNVYTEETEQQHFADNTDKRETGRSSFSDVTTSTQELNNPSITPTNPHPTTSQASSESVPVLGVLFSSIEDQLLQWSADIDRLSETLWNDAHQVLPTVFADYHQTLLHTQTPSPQPTPHVDEQYHVYLADPTTTTAAEHRLDTDPDSVCNNNGEYNDWYQSFYEGWLLGWQSMCAELLQDNTSLVYQAHQQLVPHYMDEQTFFARYWWRQKQRAQYNKAATTPRHETAATLPEDGHNNSTIMDIEEKVASDEEADVASLDDEPMPPRRHEVAYDKLTNVVITGSESIPADPTLSTSSTISDPALQPTKDCQMTMLQATEQSSDDDEEEDMENEDGWIDVHQVVH